jgi:HD-like signal output (HDOD) protein/CheY-like chemotaxis protein
VLIKVLFVDDEPHVLDGLRRNMHSMRDEWDMRFCSGSVGALQQLELEAADVVVSDMRMPGVDGSQLLAQVKRRYPQTIRFILSGQAERDAVIRATRNAHRYLSKPCDALALKAAIARALSLKRLMADDTLAEIVGNVATLPSPPGAYLRLRECLDSAEASIDNLANLIERDVALTAKVVKLVNSSFFGHREPILNIARAIALLGTDTLSALVLGDELYDAGTSILVPEFSLVRLSAHSFQTAAWARAVAAHEGLPPTTIEQAFLAGLLHDAGRLVLATRKRPSPVQDLERRQAATPLGMVTHHSAVGAYLLGLWAFPEAIVEAILWHHCPSQSGKPGLCLAGLVHIGDQLAHEAASPDEARSRGLEPGYLESLSATKRWAEWGALGLAREGLRK